MSDSMPTFLIGVVPKFPLGGLHGTPGALSSISHEEMQTALARHISGDWGELDQEDLKANDRALVEGTRLFSAYTTKSGVRFWIITEWNRSATTILLPEEY